VLPARAGSRGQRAPAAQGAVRFGLPPHHAAAVAGRLRGTGDQARGPAAGAEGQRGADVGTGTMTDLGLGSWPARRARITPDRVALRQGERSLTYAELAGRVDTLAAGL